MYVIEGIRNAGWGAAKAAIAAAAAVAAMAALLTGVPSADAQQSGQNQSLEQLQRDLYPDREWSGFNGSGLNHSVYAYRDRNRNGVHDLGDMPMANVAIVMRRPNGSVVVRRSNVRGFTNYRMSLMERDSHIPNPGTYEFVAVPPPGWILTSDNARQVIRFEIVPGAVGDLAAIDLPELVGFAPELRVSGWVARRAGDGSLSGVEEARLTAIGPDGERQEIEVGDGGRYSFIASEGEWRLVADHDGESSERRIPVRETPVRVSAMVLGEELGDPRPNEVLLDFEGEAQGNVDKVRSGTGGINWHLLNAVEMLYYGGQGFINTVMSGHYLAYNSSGHPVTLWDDRGFDFVGAYLGVAWDNAEGEELIVEAWRGDQLVGREVFPLSSLGPFWFAAEYRNITRMTLKTRHYWQFVTDDMVIRSHGPR